MSTEAQLFKIVDPATRKSEAMTEVDFAQLGFQERRDIQEWVAANPSILGDDLLVVGKEISDFDRTNERLDLLAVDKDGKLVVIELKRDDSGTDAHWQAIKYASYLHRARQNDIVRMLASHEEVSEEDAKSKLLQHLDVDELETLNSDQRIILASHRFAPEVTSAALWLNEKAPGDNLITCVQLIPYRDGESVYVQANTIIPVPGVDEYIVSVGSSVHGESGQIRSSFAENLRKTYARNKDDEVTHFLRKVANRAIEELSDDLMPDKKSRWAGEYYDRRYFRMWYKREPWKNWGMAYCIDLYPGGGESPNTWRADLGLQYWDSKIENLEIRLKALPRVHKDQSVGDGWVKVERNSDALDDAFADELAETIRPFIQQITPLIDRLQDESNEEDA